VLYDGTRMTVGRTSPAELEALIHGGGRVGQIYADLAKLRDRYSSLILEKFPRIPRRVSGYNLDELLDENGFTWPARWWAPKALAPQSLLPRST